MKSALTILFGLSMAVTAGAAEKASVPREMQEAELVHAAVANKIENCRASRSVVDNKTLVTVYLKDTENNFEIPYFNGAGELDISMKEAAVVLRAYITAGICKIKQ